MVTDEWHGTDGKKEECDKVAVDDGTKAVVMAFVPLVFGSGDDDGSGGFVLFRTTVASAAAMYAQTDR